MLNVCVPARRRATLIILPLLLAALILMSLPAPAFAQQAAGGEANLVLPDLAQATFLGGTTGRVLLMWGLGVCFLGLLFGFVTFTQLRNLPVHKSMLEISELIYATCKTYLRTQARFIAMLHSGVMTPPAMLLNSILADLDRFVGNAPQHDDVTCVLMRVV